MLAARIGQRSPCSRRSGTDARVDPAPRRTAFRDSRCPQCDFPSRLKHPRRSFEKGFRAVVAPGTCSSHAGRKLGSHKSKDSTPFEGSVPDHSFRLGRATPGKKLIHAWAVLFQPRVESACDSPKFATGWGRLRLTRSESFGQSPSLHYIRGGNGGGRGD